jgi:hypothetical protein
MTKLSWEDFFLLLVANSLEVFVKVIAGLIAPRLQLQVQVTVTSLGSWHRSGECAKSCVPAIRAVELPVVFACLLSSSRHVTEVGGPYGLWDLRWRFSCVTDGDCMDALLLYLISLLIFTFTKQWVKLMMLSWVARLSPPSLLPCLLFCSSSCVFSILDCLYIVFRYYCGERIPSVVHLCSQGTLKANSHIPCRSAKGLDCVFPIWFTQCSRVWFTHAMPFPCRFPAMPRPCRAETDLSRPRHSPACKWHGYGMVCVN